MIVINLMGGLGNQMFQYALGRQLSLLNQTELLLDCNFLNTAGAHIKRDYELDIFPIKARIATAKELKPYQRLQHNRLFRLLRRKAPTLLTHHLIAEKTHAFDPEVLTSPDHSWLTGFWQTENYFIQIEEVIRSDFEFLPPLSELNKTLAEKICSCESLSIHIRRGDYTQPKTLEFHGLCSPEYYYKAVDVISRRTRIEQLFIFSDDPQWVTENLKFDFPATYISHNTGKNSFEDMRLMSLCKHNIIANSSFSWWGAWLNANKKKIVIAPKTWIANKQIDTKDVVPLNWIKL